MPLPTSPWQTPHQASVWPNSIAKTFDVLIVCFEANMTNSYEDYNYVEFMDSYLLDEDEDDDEGDS